MAGAVIPSNWQGFLHVNSNKTQLFRFLSDSLYQTLDLKGKQLVITQEEPVFSKPLLQENASLSPCSHEEADSRMLLHANHAHAMAIRRF